MVTDFTANATDDSYYCQLCSLPWTHWEKSKCVSSDCSSADGDGDTTTEYEYEYGSTGEINESLDTTNLSEKESGEEDEDKGWLFCSNRFNGIMFIGAELSDIWRYHFFSIQFSHIK